MASLIFITSSYLPSPDANGACVSQVIAQLRKEGHRIICICSKNDDQMAYEVSEGVEIYRVKKTLYALLLERTRENGGKTISLKILTLLRRIRSLMLLPVFPNTEPRRAGEIYRLVESIAGKRAIDCVIGAFRPFEGVSAAIRIKKKHPGIVCGGYYLDIMKGSAVSGLLPQKMYSRLCDKRELKIFGRLDFVLMAEAGPPIYGTPFFKAVEAKIRYINFPLLRNISEEAHRTAVYDKEYLNIVYAGYLDSAYRNPSFIFKVIETLCRRGCKIRIHLYGRSDCGEIIDKYCRRNPDNFRYYGQVDGAAARGAILSADAVLNISNRTENIVPSKVFELFSSCKPIINVITNPDDPCLGYFSRYPCVCTLDGHKENIEAEAGKLMEFLYNGNSATVSYEEIEPLYYSSTPAATTGIINEYLLKESRA